MHLYMLSAIKMSMYNQEVVSLTKVKVNTHFSNGVERMDSITILIRIILLFFIAIFSTSLTYSDTVTPSDRVTNSLSIRADPNSNSNKIGKLYPGQKAELIGQSGAYYRIKTEQGIEGYVAKSWSTLIPASGTLTIVTWNLEGPTGIDNKDLNALAEFINGADAVVLEEVLGQDQVDLALTKASLTSMKSTVSDFAKDSEQNVYKKQELAILSPHNLGKIIEVDPYPQNDTPEMRAKDIDFDVPDFIPSDQRSKKGARGWLWVDIPSLKISIIGVHLKSSQGATGKQDEINSFKREAVSAALAIAIKEDSINRPTWSYIVAGDFNVAPGDIDKVGVDFNAPCTNQKCVGYDQTHAIFGGGIVEGFVMRNLVEGISSSYAKGNFVQSPIDNIYAYGPIFDKTTKLTIERGATFGSDHYAIKVAIKY